DLHDGNTIISAQLRDQAGSYGARRLQVLRRIYVAARVEQKKNVGRNATDASDLLRHAIFEQEYVVCFERRVRMLMLVL
ncbi:hypothetical protein OFB99_27425, partial [Escherichia coli]|nr:hypothetical protein [Escherichia coli]